MSKITHIQLFDYAAPEQTNEDGDFDMIYNYSANIVVNHEFIIQVSGDKDVAHFDGVCSSEDCYWNSMEAQDSALQNVDSRELEKELESAGFENNIGWLAENADEIMNPENAKYRND